MAFNLPLAALAQEEAVTQNGKTVLLYSDNTWKFKEELADTVNYDTAAIETASADSTAAPAPKKPKGYSDKATGFRGFLIPELTLQDLPDRAEGVYEFKVKINKEGYVKEIVTMVRGPHGQAEQLMRNTIMRLKFLPDGSIVPPLTEGTIRITVSADHQ